MSRIATTAVCVASLTAFAGAIGVADTDPVTFASETPAFGAMASEVAIDDIWVDAERVFVKVDVDRNGLVDIDEYAAQAVVYAGLVRASGIVPIDGRTLLHVGVPPSASGALSVPERAAIDAVARAEYYETVAAEGEITPRRWIQLRMGAFDRADRNEDGRLTGRELDKFASDVAAVQIEA